MSLEFRGARDEGEVAGAYELAARVFGPNYFDSRVHKDRLLGLEPPADLRDVIIARRGSEIAGVVRIVDRAVRLGSETLAVGGITAVAIRPDLQGQGAGRGIMEAALDRSRERGDVLSIAFARRAVDGFYWRLGYVGLGCHPRITVVVPPQTSTAESVRVEPGYDPAHEACYRRAYDITYSRMPLSFARSEALWRTIPDRLAWGSPARFMTVFDRVNPIGYYVVADGAVIEAAAADQVSLRDALVKHEAREELVLALRPEHPVAAAFHGFNQTVAIRYAWDGGHVVRVLDGAAFAAALVAGDREVQAHDDARRVLLEAAGIDTAAGSPLLSPLPAWSRVDEF